jgi:DNA-binding NarL/FixJ family response regulator
VPHLAAAPPMAEKGARLCVAIVEDDRTTREGLAMLIDGSRGCRCVGAYRSVEEALQSGGGAGVDVVLLDIDLPGMPGSEGVRPLRGQWPAAEILMLTVFPDDAKIFESICNGAVGYLLKKTPAPRLLAAIGEAAAGGAPMSPEIARKVVTLFRRVAPPPDAHGLLTPQETLVLQRLADGYGYQAIGVQLGISVNTVRSHIRAVYEKLHVHSKSAAVSQALRRGLIR